MTWSLRKLPGYVKWLEGLRLKEVGQIEARLKRIADEGHFGSVRDLSDGLWEMKFNNGNRIYYARTGKTELTLILGGDKNGQEGDMEAFREILSAHVKAVGVQNIINKTHLTKSTIYSAIKEDANPTIETVFQILKTGS